MELGMKAPPLHGHDALIYVRTLMFTSRCRHLHDTFDIRRAVESDLSSSRTDWILTYRETDTDSAEAQRVMQSWQGAITDAVQESFPLPIQFAYKTARALTNPNQLR
jgi:hypothetical protein